MLLSQFINCKFLDVQTSGHLNIHTHTHTILHAYIEISNFDIRSIIS